MSRRWQAHVHLASRCQKSVVGGVPPVTGRIDLYAYLLKGAIFLMMVIKERCAKWLTVLAEIDVLSSPQYNRHVDLGEDFIKGLSPRAFPVLCCWSP